MRLNLADCREKAGLSLKDVSKILKIGVKTLEKYEAGVISPKLDLGWEMSMLYRVPMGGINFSLDAQRA